MIFFDNTNMQIPYLPFLDSNDLRQAGEQLNKIDFHRIGQNNWPEQFPYTPYAAFTMAHNGEMLFIRFKVDETSTMALTRKTTSKCVTIPVSNFSWQSTIVGITISNLPVSVKLC